MDPMKIEWVYKSSFLNANDLAIAHDTSSAISQLAPVVRLAAVDAILAEAVWAMEKLQTERRWLWANVFDLSPDAYSVDRQLAVDDLYLRAQAFLDNLAAWRKGQEGAT